ncbi:alpha/beta-hydrolase [Pilatotrama ljubarskyi]|nr:alpha/beta-hydrolase [Pilatotrama ljubarskyi]
MVNILKYQPFKGLYIVYFASTLVFFKVPFWALQYLPRSKRPRSTWTLKRSIIVRTIRELFTFKVPVGLKTALDSPKEVSDRALTDAKFVWVDGVPEELLRGEVQRIAEITGVKPARNPGYWLLKEGSAWSGPKAKPGEKTVLHMHGGAFHLGTANPSDITSNITRGLLLHSQSLERTFAVDYRLTASAPHPPANPFPAALLDTIAAYRYLVGEAGFDPKDVIVAGDSAGGNLAVGLVRYLVENPIPSLPPPGHLLVISPWLDVSTSRCGPNSSAIINNPTDIFPDKPGEPFAMYAVRSLLGPLDPEEAKTNPYFSPVSLHVKPDSGLFKDFPETYVVAGGAERLLDDSTVLMEKMEADGVKVTSDVLPDAVHDFLVFIWHEPERTEVLRKIGQWIDRM